MKKNVFLLFFLVLLASCGTHRMDLSRYVDPFIGTGGHGHTYPGATLPFGMVQLSPDTRLSGWDGCSGYHYSDTVIYGFSHTHLSGTGVSDYGDILLMPMTGSPSISNEINGDRKGYPSRFSHHKEEAEPGYYRVFLDDYQVQAEFTASLRCGFHRYTFPEGAQANIVLDLVHRDPVIQSSIEIINDHEIRGSRISREWAREQHIYFVIRFSEPVRDHDLFSNDSLITGANRVTGKHLKSWYRFDLPGNKPLLVKVGISAVSIEGAVKNLEAEIPGWDFFAVRHEAKDAWNKQLSRIIVRGGSEEKKKIFYTALYHCFLAPNLYMDVDGRYRGRDMQIHQAGDFTNYTVFSLWDTFRGLHPLFTLLEPERTLDFIKTFLVQYQQGGMLPVWELAANETNCMIGYHSVSVIADAWMKDIDHFNHSLALEAAVNSAMQDQSGLKYYKESGFVPANEESESVSKTLEYAYDDWCIAQMAKQMGQEKRYEEFIRRAQYYKNLFDPGSGFMRARMNGGWFSPFDPREVNFNYTEANAWQYSFFVPQDIAGLIQRMGGRNSFAIRLDHLFTEKSQTTGRNQADITGMIGQYAHGNEPSHHMAYLFNYAGQPWKTQEMVRRIREEMYSAQPDGLAGNEDCGQMSAWYVLSALGFYPVCPGLPRYDAGIPLFPRIEVHGSGNQRFAIRAKHLDNRHPYISKVILNGRATEGLTIDHKTLVNGRTLVFVMGREPSPVPGEANSVLPVTSIMDYPIIPVPFLEKGNQSFSGSTMISIRNIDNDTVICRIQGEGGEFTMPDTLHTDKSMTIEAWCRRNGSKSAVVTFPFSRILPGRTLHLCNVYSYQYSAGGPDALIDGIRGGEDFRTGTWQGYEGVDLIAYVQLEKPSVVRKVSIGFFQDINAWIFLPREVAFYISSDGTNYQLAGTVYHTVPLDKEGAIRHTFQQSIKTSMVKAIRVEAKNIGYCPPWHKGADEKAWIFADEIVIE